MIKKYKIILLIYILKNSLIIFDYIYNNFKYKKEFLFLNKNLFIII